MAFLLIAAAAIYCQLITVTVIVAPATPPPTPSTRLPGTTSDGLNNSTPITPNYYEVVTSVVTSSEATEGQKTTPPLLSNAAQAAQAAHEVRHRQEKMSLLFGELFADYKKEVAPSTPVEVDLKVLLIKVKNTVERDGIFECVVALFIAWHDTRLQWDPSNYDNVTTLAFEPERLWLPDIAMTNSADHVYQISRDTRFVVLLSYDGRATFVPSGTSRTWCDLKLVTFPFDQQTCSLDFESWTLDNSSLTFSRESNVLVDDSNSNYYSTQWKLCYYKTVIRNITYSDSMSGTFQRISFTLNIHRKSSFYLVNLIFPISMLSVIQLLIFFIPGIDSASSRIGFGTTNLLTLVVFQTIVTEELPKTSDAVTALSQYIIALILFSAYGIFESVVIECMLRMEQKPPPKCIRRLVELITRRKEYMRNETTRSVSQIVKDFLTPHAFAIAKVTPKTNHDGKLRSSIDRNIMMDVDVDTQQKATSPLEGENNTILELTDLSPTQQQLQLQHQQPTVSPQCYGSTSVTSSAHFFKRTPSNRSLYDNNPTTTIADNKANENVRKSSSSTAGFYNEFFLENKNEGGNEEFVEEVPHPPPPISYRLVSPRQHRFCSPRKSTVAFALRDGNYDVGRRRRRRQSNIFIPNTINNNNSPTKTAAKSRPGAYPNNNYLYWSDCAMILDYVSFFLCTCLALFIPAALFIPLIRSTDKVVCM